jgi:3'(2'), 5'-bisphosphate nucleotidase
MDNHQMITAEWLERLVSLGREAGAAIMAIYQTKESYQISHKTDESPLTAADLAAHHLILRQLPALLDVPIISEEGSLPAFAERQAWERYWLVDPLDGTKEFIAGNGEFTVNIALVDKGKSLVGLVHIPVADVTYLGVLAAQEPGHIGAWKYQGAQTPQAIKVSPLQYRHQQGLPLRLLLSHRHGTSETRQLVDHLQQRWPGGITESNAGSSLKFCRIAEGEADFYPRLAPTSEWDTAAAQAVLDAAGGLVVMVPESGQMLQPLRYNTREDVLNPHFYALGDAGFDWSELLDTREL